MTHSPDLEAAEKIVMEVFGWDAEQAAVHYPVYQRAVDAAIRGIRAERQRSANVAYAIVLHEEGSKFANLVQNAIMDGPPSKEI